MKTFLIAIILGVFIPSAADAATYYVTKTGSNSNTCTQAQSKGTAKLTVAAGIACLGSGDTLRIGAGTYSEKISVTQSRSGASWSSATTIMADTAGTVVIVGYLNLGSSSGHVSYMIFDGLIIDGNWDPSNYAVVPANSASNIRFQNSEIRNGRDHGIIGGTFMHLRNVNVHHNGKKPDGTVTCTVGGGNPGLCHGVYFNGDGHLIEGGSYYNNAGHGIHLYSLPTNAIVRNIRALSNTVGIGVYNGSNHKVYNNLVYNNLSQGIMTSSAGSFFANNTVYGHKSYPGISLAGDNNMLRNNIASNNPGGNINIRGSGHTITNNLCSLSGTYCAVVESASNTFTDATNNSFTLKSSSQAIEKGFNLTTNGVTTDILGVSRPQGSAHDIGAYEYLVAGAGLNAPTNLQVSPH